MKAVDLILAIGAAVTIYNVASIIVAILAYRSKKKRDKIFKERRL